MTTPDDPKVKELLEALREAHKIAPPREEMGTISIRVFDALAAFDPPKPKQYPPMPPWDEFATGKALVMGKGFVSGVDLVTATGNVIEVKRAVYEAIRLATAKD